MKNWSVLLFGGLLALLTLFAACKDGGGGGTSSATTGTSGGTSAGSSSGSSTSTATNDPVLLQGDQGAAVTTLQGLLNGWRQRDGYALIAVDGQFGPQTQGAVEEFQLGHGLAATGIVEQDTWDRLRAPFATDRLGRIDPINTPTSADTYLRSGSQPPDVALHSLSPVEVQPGVFENPLLYQSSMAIDADGAGTAWMSDPWGQPSTSLTYPNGDALDPTLIHYFVLPIGFEALHPEVRLGDVAAIVYRGQVTYAIYGDRGPTGKIGEASIASAGALGINANPVSGGVAYGVTYIVFPGSGSRTPLTPADTETIGRNLFLQAGGNP